MELTEKFSRTNMKSRFPGCLLFVQWSPTSLRGPHSKITTGYLKFQLIVGSPDSYTEVSLTVMSSNRDGNCMMGYIEITWPRCLASQKGSNGERQDSTKPHKMLYNFRRTDYSALELFIQYPWSGLTEKLLGVRPWTKGRRQENWRRWNLSFPSRTLIELLCSNLSTGDTK